MGEPHLPSFLFLLPHSTSSYYMGVRFIKAYEATLPQFITRWEDKDFVLCYLLIQFLVKFSRIVP
jgi:hypothetical protein